MSDDNLSMGLFGHESNPFDLNKKKDTLLGAEADHADYSGLADLATAFSIHKDKQKQADKVNFLRTILSGDQTQPIIPQTPAPAKTGAKQAPSILGG